MINQKDYEVLQGAEALYKKTTLVPTTFWSWVKSALDVGISAQTRLSQAEDHIDTLTTAGNNMMQASKTLVELQQKRIQELELHVAYLEGRVETFESEASNA